LGCQYSLESRRLAGILPSKRMTAKKSGSTSHQVIRDILVLNKLGVHARPAALFVKIANQFKSEVMVEKDGEVVNGKSILGLMMLAAGPGAVLRVRATGADALDAVNALESLVQARFHEE